MQKIVDISYQKEEYKKIISIKEIEEWSKEIIAQARLENVFFSIFFCDDKTMTELNKNYRDIDKTTDVLSFSQIEGEEIIWTNKKFIGDIVISMPQAVRQSEEIGKPAQSEVKLLILHGFLHLLGYDHETDDGEMDTIQKEYLKMLGETIE
ncbi:MAG TPA: rRNA maturation RNase YbeY [Spirochaetota bacterium]|jgi:probable rRNA maturation factor|nr:MAG: Endoribonuclease YbeY [Spirochaetes bacterium ADurb.Bin133]HNZ26513.1 rRNA maturation RNase YbeY [Spirochaetota bacterium]HPY86696.1 rRNA maturation RNase YbeY [Spirochaetota bacterium]HQB62170.1 rRNA maturation RNase YbeY [Spirochaetota bacterium]